MSSNIFKEYRLDDVRRKLSNLSYNILDVLVTGSTGVGKSTTLNSLFEKAVAKVGHGVEPETMDIASYIRDNNIRVWDTPGFGDGVERDKVHAKKIIDLLNRTLENDRTIGYIDMVIVIIDASQRDLGTAYQLINEIIIPNMNERSRILIGLNQADFAMKGIGFDYKKNIPNYELKSFLEDKVKSIKKRVAEATGMRDCQVVYYSAQTGYNVDKFLDAIIDNIPNCRRKLF